MAAGCARRRATKVRSGMVNGKAKLLRDDYCDGLGDCLPVCPTDAISFEEREAAAYDAEAVKKIWKRERSRSPAAVRERSLRQ